MPKEWSFEYQWKRYNAKYLSYGMSPEQDFKKFCHDLQIKKENLRGKKVLDAGCGSGRLTKSISKYTLETYGVDIVPLPPDDYKCKFLREDIQNLPFKDNFFDYVYCRGVLHHISNPQKAFVELARVNKNKIFIMVYTKRNIFMKLRKYLRIFQLTFIKYFLKLIGSLQLNL